VPVHRKVHPAFGQGSYEFLDSGSRSVLAVIHACGTEAILAARNLSPVPQHVQSDLLPLARRVRARPGRWPPVP
jgi:maltose alpha-D-glucosyltransferase/alpha-amylase